MSSKPKFSTLFILGLGHSGSTLLGRMLGSHPDAVFVGELLRLEQAVARPQERCSCGALVAECPVWQRRIESLPEGVRTDFQRWTLQLIERLRKSENKALLVDSSKSRVLRLKSKWNSPQTGYVLLVRDPRGALRSALQEGGDLQKLLTSSRKWMRRYEEFVQRRGAVCLTMFYEDLTTSTETELRRLCEFVGLDYTPNMCQPDQQSFHLIRASRSPYLKAAGRLKTDDRWRSVLTPRQTEAIGRSLGKLAIYRDRYKLAQSPAVGTVSDRFRRVLKKLQGNR
jgi:hypothetical protein